MNLQKEFHKKKLLVIGSVFLERDIVERAQAMGAYVAVADYKENSPAKEFADEKLLIDALDVDSLVKYCIENKIDGVTTGFNDMLMPVCMDVCKRINHPYYVTPKMLSMSTNKTDFKETCLRYGIPVPKTYYSGANIQEVDLDKIDYPVFVKPLDASGSKGAGVCYSKDELIKNFKTAKSFSKTSSVIIEEYLVGNEFLLDYIAVDGEFRLLSMFDRYMCDDRGSARNYANLSMAPSRAIDNYLENMNDRVIDMFKDLGFRDGLIFLQGHINGDSIVFYEMGCRLGGSFYHLEQDCIGLNPIDMTIRYAFTGKMVSSIDTIDKNISRFDKYAFAYNFLLCGDNETIADIRGLDIINELPSYVSSIQQRYIGSSYKKDGLVDKPLITVYLSNYDLDQAKRDMKKLKSQIQAYNKEGHSLLMKRFNPDELDS